MKHVILSLAAILLGGCTSKNYPNIGDCVAFDKTNVGIVRAVYDDGFVAVESRYNNYLLSPVIYHVAPTDWCSEILEDK